MTTTKLIKSLVIAALFAGVSAHAADQNIVVAQEDGSRVATFSSTVRPVS